VARSANGPERFCLTAAMSLFDQKTAETVSAYRSCEFATLAKDGTPITWPVAAMLNADGTLTLTTSVGFPQKAFNVRRDGWVALLFSDPTGSGLDTPDQVLVTGTAACADEIVTTPGELADYWRMLFERQPSSRVYLKPLIRPVVDWYYMRLVITVTPAAVTTRPALAETTGSPEFGDLLGASVLGAYASAVLGGGDAGGAPSLLRVHPRPGEGGYRVELPADTALVPGPASLLVHRHDDLLADARFALVRGELTGGPGEWLLVPSRLIEPFDAAKAVSGLRRTRRAAKSYLAHRGLRRPRIDWAAFTAVANSVTRR
jgi:hypothetical protein